MAILKLLTGTWKVWLPALVLLSVAGTIWYQKQRINYLEEVRNVAIAEHDRAMEEQRQLLDDIKRLNTVLETQKEIDRQLGENLENAKIKLRNLESNSPAVDRWLDTPIPDGVWKAVTGGDRPPRRDSKSPD